MKSPALYYITNGSCIEKYVFGLNCTNTNSNGAFCSCIQCELNNSHSFSCYSNCFGSKRWVSTLNIRSGDIELNNANFSFNHGESNTAYFISNSKKVTCFIEYLHVQTNNASYTRIAYYQAGNFTLRKSNFVNNSHLGHGIIFAEYSSVLLLKNIVAKDNKCHNSFLCVLESSAAAVFDVTFENNSGELFYNDDTSKIDSSQQGNVSKEIFINLPSFNIKLPKIYIDTCPVKQTHMLNLSIFLIIPLIMM